MTLNRREWNRLQERWAAGDELSPEQERARLDSAARDPLAAHELEIYGELLRRMAECGPRDGEPTLVARVLEQARSRPEPRLRLVRAAPEAAGPFRSPSPWPRRMLWAGSLAGAAGLVLGLAGPWSGKATHEASSHRARSTPAALAPTLTRAELVFTSGRVDKDDGPADVGRATLHVGERITTAAGHACLTIDPTIDVCLGEATRIVLDGLADRDVRIRVDQGTVVSVLGKRARGRSFALVAGSMAAVARGTAFAVTHSPEAESTSVAVLEGEVQITEHSQPTTRLSAHFRLDVGSGKSQGSVAVMSRSDEARLWHLLAPRELWQGLELGILDIAPGADGTRVLLDQEGPHALPLRTFLPVGERRVVVRDPTGRENRLVVEIAAGERRALNPERLARVTSAIAGNATDMSPADLLAEARRELGRGNRKAALSLYRRLRAAYPQAPEAFTVLVTLGKLELEVSSPARALATFESYLQRGGPLSPEALAGKIRALRGLGRASDERKAIEQYLARYPTGLDAPALEQRRHALGFP